MEKETNKQSTIIINNSKNEKFREKLKHLLPLIFETRSKKSKDFHKAVKQFKNDANYEFYHPLIERQFLYKAVHKINKELTKNKEGSLLDFTSRLHKFFENEFMLYWKLNRYITEDEILGINLINEDFDFLNAIITEHANDKKIIPFFKKLKIDLAVIDIDVY